MTSGHILYVLCEQFMRLFQTDVVHAYQDVDLTTSSPAPMSPACTRKGRLCSLIIYERKIRDTSVMAGKISGVSRGRPRTILLDSLRWCMGEYQQQSRSNKQELRSVEFHGWLLHSARHMTMMMYQNE